MRLTQRACCCGLAIAVGLAVPGIAAANPRDRQVSPGTVTLLALATPSPESNETLRAALEHADPRVRAAAARVAAARPRAELTARLNEILASETDPGAALEEAYALLAVTGGTAVAPVVSAAKRLASPRPGPFIEAIARYNRQPVERSVASVRDLTNDADVLRSFIEVAAQGVADNMLPLGLEAVHRNDEPLAVAVLDAWRWPMRPLANELIHAAAQSASSEVRGRVCWALLGQLVSVRQMTESLPDISIDGLAPEAAFGCVLARRAAGGVAPDARDLIAILEDSERQPQWPRGALQLLRGTSPASRLLTTTEAAALAKLLTASTPSDGSRDVLPEAQAEGPPTVRLLSGYPAGVLEGTFDAAGCRPGKTAAVGAGLGTYQNGGRPREVALVNTGLSEPCQRAVQALLITSRLPAADSVTAGRWLMVVPLIADVWRCRRDPFANMTQGPATPPRVGNRVKPPRKTRDARPRYPVEVQQQRYEGTVVMEAQITPEGCIDAAAVLKSAHPLLDIEAVVAVSQWRFTPTLLNGVAVPVVMTVTVQFTLQ